MYSAAKSRCQDCNWIHATCVHHHEDTTRISAVYQKTWSKPKTLVTKIRQFTSVYITVRKLRRATSKQKIGIDLCQSSWEYQANPESQRFLCLDQRSWRAWHQSGFQQTVDAWHAKNPCRICLSNHGQTTKRIGLTNNSFVSSLKYACMKTLYLPSVCRWQ